MSKSARIRLSDIKQVYRILDEVADLSHDPDLWRPHLSKRLLQFFNLQMAGVYVMPFQLDAADANVSKMELCGIDESAVRLWVEYGKRGNLTSDPCTPAIMSKLPNAISVARQMLCDDQAWYQSGYYHDFKRVMRADDLILSLLPVPQLGLFHGMHGDRSKGQKPMGRRETVCMGLIHQELGRKWQRALSQSPAERSLSPRLAELLNHLRGPKSEKEIAHEMHLSPHTVHNHIRRLYARMNVQGRHQLIFESQSRLVGVPRLGIAGL
ncbi:MAG TPA: LuxR C-terminal-related transcriptional regulator [Tepidisphaeraceae bacterium]|jgi:DNA-binding CsgD family transcriptional regulator|nr:LuxR C-terminal-related transcriptional regulator [Tepidisphaeraceae bacterium]